MTRYEIVRGQDGTHSRHPDQPEFASATEASLWAAERDLDGSWYIRPVEASHV